MNVNLEKWKCDIPIWVMRCKSADKKRSPLPVNGFSVCIKCVIISP